MDDRERERVRTELRVGALIAEHLRIEAELAALDEQSGALEAHLADIEAKAKMLNARRAIISNELSPALGTVGAVLWRDECWGENVVTRSHGGELKVEPVYAIGNLADAMHEPEPIWDAMPPLPISDKRINNFNRMGVIECWKCFESARMPCDCADGIAIGLTPW